MKRIQFFTKVSSPLRKLLAVTGLASILTLSSASSAQEPVRIAFMDPLSGAFASVGNSGLKQLQYDTFDSSVYRLVHDSDSYARGATSATFENQWCDNKDVAKKLNFEWKGPVGTNHMPEDDAEGIFRFHVLTVKHAR